MLRYLALAAVLVLALVAAGCGGNDKGSLSKSQFLKKGNAICTKGNQEIEAAGRQVFTGHEKPSRAKLVAFVKATVIPSVQRQIDQLRALGAPKGDESKVKAILDAAQRGLDHVKQNPVLAAQNGPGPFKQADDLANAYGLTVCGSS